MNSEEQISRLLTQRVLTQLGATPSLANKISLCHKDLHVGTINVKEQEFNEEVDRKLPFWKGMMVGDTGAIYKGMVVNFGTDEDPEFLALIASYTSVDDEVPDTCYALHYTWADDDTGQWLAFVQGSDSWMPLSLHSKLMLAAWSEGVTQSGELWAVCLDPEKRLEDLLRKVLVFL